MDWYKKTLTAHQLLISQKSQFYVLCTILMDNMDELRRLKPEITDYKDLITPEFISLKLSLDSPRSKSYLINVSHSGFVPNVVKKFIKDEFCFEAYLKYFDNVETSEYY